VCLPYRVEVVEGVGRCVVATRLVTAGELILEESPAVVGPCFDTPPVCLECLGGLGEGGVPCTRSDPP